MFSLRLIVLVIFCASSFDLKLYNSEKIVCEKFVSQVSSLKKGVFKVLSNICDDTFRGYQF